jgi:hypothetical protein
MFERKKTKNQKDKRIGKPTKTAIHPDQTKNKKYIK